MAKAGLCIGTVQHQLPGAHDDSPRRSWAGYRAEWSDPAEKLSVVLSNNPGLCKSFRLGQTVVQIVLNRKTYYRCHTCSCTRFHKDRCFTICRRVSIYENNDAVRKAIAENDKLFMQRGAGRIERVYSSDNAFVVPEATLQIHWSEAIR